ncbi:MAG: DciA family protein [Candidatus Peregrinibacteria bacterium]|nr:DciA family protein [Candidatus Peregrinibacteria bacterium]
MDHIGSILSKVLKKRGLHGHAEASLVVHRAQEWINDHLPLVAAALHPRTFTDGTLIIAADHAIALQECQMEIPALQTWLTAEAHPALVKDIRLLRAK